ncbi:YlbG family protein [Tenuibacillus multivorans]|uniref:UPF0298 protein SAMN05216498_1291 n=1 Tax=Tenuibacillus multivorans TaxID=237069 RepID=A0A1G9Y8Y0_9BACI|nr:DUF2129 domain-containing protein [Tenuibacillus multivorans]GEL75995.1 UPF0298 protein [Tenuibacillus multivorans]SDN05487.1 Uncharacterized protein YlbG, UPF0298 family [Tenuibacillus multivorans]
MITKRQGIIVWVKHIKYAKRLRRYGHLIYASRKQRYLLIYVDQDQIEDTLEQIRRLNFVKNVEISYKPYIDTVYQTKVPKKDKEYEMKSVF